jgi:hypothetical protein
MIWRWLRITLRFWLNEASWRPSQFAAIDDRSPAIADL